MGKCKKCNGLKFRNTKKCYLCRVFEKGFKHSFKRLVTQWNNKE